MLVMIPFWTSFLIRTYAWMTILKSEGLLNGAAAAAPDDRARRSRCSTRRRAVVLGLVYTFLPFMILPIYTSVEKLDNALVEAAFDLGAGPVRAFSRVIVPLTSPGIVAGVLLVFIPALGMFAVNDLLGGGKVDMIGNVIENQFKGNARNWPFGAALGMTLLLAFARRVLVHEPPRARRAEARAASRRAARSVAHAGLELGVDRLPEREINPLVTIGRNSPPAAWCRTTGEAVSGRSARRHSTQSRRVRADRGSDRAGSGDGPHNPADTG